MITLADLELKGDLMAAQQLCHLEMIRGSRLSEVPYFSTPIHIESTVEQSHYISTLKKKEGCNKYLELLPPDVKLV